MAVGNPEDFYADFYVAVATVVPVIWLTVGLAGQASDGVKRLLAAAGHRAPALLALRRIAMTTFLAFGLAAECASLVALAVRATSGGLRVFTLICALGVVVQGGVLFGLALRATERTIGKAQG